MYANIFCDAGQVPILRYFEAWIFPLKLGVSIIPTYGFGDNITKDIFLLKLGVSIIPTYGFGDNIFKDKDIFHRKPVVSIIPTYGFGDNGSLRIELESLLR